MSQCPKCQSSINEDFGLVTCGSCASILLVEWDGSVRVCEEESVEVKPTGEESVELEPSGEPAWDEPVQDLSAESTFSSTTFEGAETSSLNESNPTMELEDSGQEDFYGETGDVMETSGAVEEVEREASSLPAEASPGPDWEEKSSDAADNASRQDSVGAESPSWSENNWSDGEVKEPLVQPPVIQETSTDFLDVSSYGNSEVSAAQEGPLRFNIYLIGIDDLEILNFVREVLQDEKFMWEVDELIGRVHNGELELREVSAVKAALLVSRLKFTSLQIRWEQYTIQQA